MGSWHFGVKTSFCRLRIDIRFILILLIFTTAAFSTPNKCLGTSWALYVGLLVTFSNWLGRFQIKLCRLPYVFYGFALSHCSSTWIWRIHFGSVLTSMHELCFFPCFCGWLPFCNSCRVVPSGGGKARLQKHSWFAELMDTRRWSLCKSWNFLILKQLPR